MVSTPKMFINNSPISPRTPSPVNKPNYQKSLCIFTNVVDVKRETSYRRVGASKSKRKAIKFGNTPCSLKQK